MKIYNIYQSGKCLYIDEKENPDNKIVCNKYESEQTTLRLISDNTLPPRLYWALRNPKLSEKYFILPLVNDNELIIGTDISATPGLWDMILIGTGDDYIIEGTDIDQSKITYISDVFSRLFVRDNYLEELDFEEQTSPTFRVFYDEIMFRLQNKEEKSLVAEYGITTYEEIKEAYERGVEVRVKYIVEIINSLEPGTYDKDGNLLQSWDELMSEWGRDIEVFSPPYNDLGYIISDDATKLVIPDGITKIGGYFMSYGCNIEIVVFPSTLTWIYSSALGLSTLKQIAVPNGVETLTINYNKFECIYFNGKLQGPYASSIECLPYEDAPAELVPGEDVRYDYLGNLEFIDNNFVFYTTKDDMPLKIVCSEDGWSCEVIEYALSEDIPKKVSELENDLYGYEREIYLSPKDSNIDFFYDTDLGVYIYEGEGVLPESSINDLIVNYKPLISEDVVGENEFYSVKDGTINTKQVNDNLIGFNFKTSKCEVIIFSGIDFATLKDSIANDTIPTVSINNYVITLGDILFDSLEILVGLKQIPSEYLDLPTKLSELENDSGFATKDEIPKKVSELSNDKMYAAIEKDILTVMSVNFEDITFDSSTITDTEEYTNLFETLDIKSINVSNTTWAIADGVLTIEVPSGLKTRTCELLTSADVPENALMKVSIKINTINPTKVTVYLVQYTEDMSTEIVSDPLPYILSEDGSWGDFSATIVKTSEYPLIAFRVYTGRTYRTALNIDDVSIIVDDTTGYLKDENGQTFIPHTIAENVKVDEDTDIKEYVDNLAPFIATYGTTTYEELLEAYKAKKTLHLKVTKDVNNTELTGSAWEIVACLSRVDGEGDYRIFTFTCDENGVTRYYAIGYDTKEWKYWNCKYAETIDYLSQKTRNIDTNINKLLPLLTSAYNSFRGGFRSIAGTLSIKKPGIYFIMQGGSNNKTITITQPDNVEELTKNGFIVLAYDNGVGTVIGIDAISLTSLNPISTGTYQLWTEDGTYHSEISYPAETVVAYLGNSNNDVGTWN